MKTYILKGHEAIREDDALKWALWYEKADRRVKLTEIKLSRISTVFLAIDHSWGDFETMIFGGPYNGQILRCSTWEQAKKMHNDMCEKITKHGKGKDYG